MTTDEVMRIAECWHDLPDRIQGFGYGAVYVVRDVYKPHSEQELWRGKGIDEMERQCRYHRMRLAIEGALGPLT